MTTVLLVLAGLALAGFAVDRLLLWMEWRGWIDYRRTYPGRIDPGQIGPAFLAIQGLLEPDRKYIHEEKTSARTERDEESGTGRPRRSSRNFGQKKGADPRPAPFDREKEDL
jgi:hypothetical protein